MKNKIRWLAFFPLLFTHLGSVVLATPSFLQTTKLFKYKDGDRLFFNAINDKSTIHKKQNFEADKGQTNCVSANAITDSLSLKGVIYQNDEANLVLLEPSNTLLVLRPGKEHQKNMRLMAIKNNLAIIKYGECETKFQIFEQ